MLALYENLKEETLVVKPIKQENRKLVYAIEDFYSADSISKRLLMMCFVRYHYEYLQLRASRAVEIMDKDITTIVGQFHKLSVTIVADELGDNAQYLDKLMDRLWPLVCAYEGIEEADFKMLLAKTLEIVESINA